MGNLKNVYLLLILLFSLGIFIFVVYYDNNKDKIVRVGISVSKKLGNAVIRNNIKRQVRHMFHDLKENLNNIDVIIIVRQNYKNNSFLENEKLLSRSLEKIRRKINEQI